MIMMMAMLMACDAEEWNEARMSCAQRFFEEYFPEQDVEEREQHRTADKNQ